MRLKFLTYNILDGGRGREAALTKIIKAQAADIVLVQEVAEESFVQSLAAACQAEYLIAESNSWRRIAILSRLPVREASGNRLAVLRHGLLQAQIEYTPGQRLHVMGLHLAAPALSLPVELYRLRELQVILRRMPLTGGVVLGGDFNAIAPGDAPDLRHMPRRLRLAVFLLGGHVAHQAIGAVRAAGLYDVYRGLHPDVPGYTLPAQRPNVRLDYFFVNEILRSCCRACDVVTGPAAVQAASDHLPVSMELEV
jgi:endonuclease/exonuclease/phosphatase family metal-dependent hydrolase